MKTFKPIAITIIFLLTTFNVFAQVSNTFFQMPKIVPSSPEASALLKVSDIPIEYSSGSANIDIPLYNVKEGNISVPISVTYNTSGIKVQDIAGMTGLGWNLNFGGIINVKQEVSQPGQQVLNSAFKQESDVTGGNQSLALAFCGHVVDGSQEKQNPQYYYNFGNYSGSFFYDINGQLSINAINQSLLIVKLSNGFRITTPEGIQYTFTDQEIATGTNGWTRTSAYFISQILDLNTNRFVTFKYKAKTAYNQVQESQSLYYFSIPQTTATCSFATQGSSITTSVISNIGIQIDSIKFSSGYIKFYSSADRQDIDPTRIYQISIFNKSSLEVKRISFNQSYFVSTGATSSKYNYRLKLDSITFNGINSTPAGRYGFNYNLNSLPAYQRADGHVNTGVDYWGYCNGKSYNNGLIPSNVINSADYSLGVPTGLLGDRSADSLYNQAFILNKITYPTGGSASFFYESNVVNGYPLGNVVGGLRVKKISYTDPLTGGQRNKFYKYFNGYIPLAYQNDYSYDKIKTVICTLSGGGVTSQEYSTRNVYSDPLGTLAYVIVNPFYSNVEEYEMTDNQLKQKTAYFYDTTNQFWVQAIPIPEYGNQFVTERGWLKGQLLKRTEYYKIDQSNNYQIVRKEENSYTDNLESNPQIGLHVVPKDHFDYIGGDYNTIHGGSATPGVLYNLYNAKNSHGSRVLTSKRIVDYTNTDSLVSTTDYNYLPHNINYANANNYFFYLRGTNRISSQGDALSSVIIYPIDGKESLTNLSTQFGVAIDSLKARNIISSPVEQQYLKNNVFLNKSRTNYTLQPGINNQIILPASIQYQQGTGTLDNRIDFLNYDGYGNLLTVAKDQGSPSGYLWGYSKLFPIAEGKNAATYELFYEGFEESTLNTVQTNGGHTGNNYIQASSYAVNWTQPNSKAFVISYWYRVNGVWNYSGEIPYSISYTLHNGDAYDDIRIYPRNALMTTYTYDPLIGITSSTDEKGLTIYYEYDANQRLYRLKDHNGNIIKQYCYNYAGQATDCSVPYIQPTPPTGGGATTPPVTCGKGTTNINGVCVTGTKVYDTSTSISGGRYSCTYHYEFPNGTKSQEYTETNSQPCAI